MLSFTLLSISFSVHILCLTNICVSRSGPGKVRDVTGNAKYAKNDDSGGEQVTVAQVRKQHSEFYLYKTVKQIFVLFYMIFIFIITK